MMFDIDPNDPRLLPEHLLRKEGNNVCVRGPVRNVWLNLVSIERGYSSNLITVEYWRTDEKAPFGAWIEVGTYDNEADAVAAFWNVYVLGLWR